MNIFDTSQLLSLRATKVLQQQSIHFLLQLCQHMALISMLTIPGMRIRNLLITLPCSVHTNHDLLYLAFVPKTNRHVGGFNIRPRKVLDQQSNTV